MEVEFVALLVAVQEGVWLKRLLNNLKVCKTDENGVLISICYVHKLLSYLETFI